MCFLIGMSFHLKRQNWHICFSLEISVEVQHSNKIKTYLQFLQNLYIYFYTDDKIFTILNILPPVKYITYTFQEAQVRKRRNSILLMVSVGSRQKTFSRCPLELLVDCLLFCLLQISILGRLDITPWTASEHRTSNMAYHEQVVNSRNL